MNQAAPSATSCYALKYCRKTVLISWKILAKNIFKLVFLTEALHGTCFGVVLCVCKDLRCGAKMLCAVCAESAAAGWKRICGPRQDAAKLHWKLLLHQLTVTVPSHELKSFPPCPSRPFHNAPSLSLTSLPSYHQKNRYSHKKCISWCDCEQQEQGETILCILVLGKKLVIMYQSQINQSTQPLGSDITWKRQLTDGYLLASTKPD